MNEPYSLSDEDVARYLASKGDDDPIGLCQDEEACLLVEAMIFKYPELIGRVIVEGARDALSMSIGTALIVSLSPRQQCIAAVFDACSDHMFDPIRKRPFLEAWQRNGLRAFPAVEASNG